MIIKFIAETAAERKRFNGNESVEHTNVKEYFIAGNKLDPEGSIVDFHEWNGSFRFLLGSLSYFKEIINDDRRKAGKQDESELPSNMSNRKIIPMVKRGNFGGNIQPLDISKLHVEGQQPEQPEQDGEIIEDEFVEDNTKALNFNPVFAKPEEQAEEAEEVEVATEDVVKQLQKEAKEFKGKNVKDGLKIIP